MAPSYHVTQDAPNPSDSGESRIGSRGPPQRPPKPNVEAALHPPSRPEQMAAGREKEKKTGGGRGARPIRIQRRRDDGRRKRRGENVEKLISPKRIGLDLKIPSCLGLWFLSLVYFFLPAEPSFPLKECWFEVVRVVFPAALVGPGGQKPGLAVVQGGKVEDAAL